MDKEQVRAVVKESVRETLTGLGIPDNPQQMQKYMVFIAELYSVHQNTKHDIRRTIIKICTPAIMITLWETAKNLLNR